MTHIEAVSAALTAAGIDHKIWKGIRIYMAMASRKASVYLQFDEPTATEFDSLEDGMALRVFYKSNSGNIEPTMTRNCKHAWATKLHEIGLISVAPASADEMILA